MDLNLDVGRHEGVLDLAGVWEGRVGATIPAREIKLCQNKVIFTSQTTYYDCAPLSLHDKHAILALARRATTRFTQAQHI